MVVVHFVFLLQVVSNEDGIKLAKSIGACFVKVSAKTGSNTAKLLELVDEKIEKGKISSETGAYGDDVVILNDHGTDFVSGLISNNCNC